MKQTQKSLVTMLALVVVAAAIGGVALWTQKDEQKKTEAKEKSEKLFDFDKAKVRTLRLEKDGKLVAAAGQKDGHWKIVEPLQVEADDEAVNALVTQLTTMRQKKDLGDEKDPKPYGLDKPSLRLVVRLDDGKDHSLELGEQNSFDNTLYVRRGGDPTIRLVDGWQKGTFDKSLFDLRDKRVAHIDDQATVTRVEVTGVKNPYTLVKDGPTWKLGKETADGSTADRIVSAVKTLRATAIPDVRMPAAKATAKLTVSTGKDKSTRTVVVGQSAGKTYAKRDDSPTVYEVSDQILKDLDKQPFDLQDKQLVHVDREQVRKVVFESPAGRIEIARHKDAPKDGGVAEERFEVLAPKQLPAKKWKISSALYAISGLRAAAFEKPKRSEAWQKTITLVGDGDKVLARLQVGSENGARRYVSNGEKLALVEKATLDDLPWKLEDAAEQPAADAGVQASKQP